VKTHHTTRKNTMVHTVASPHSRKFAVTRWAVLSYDPEWVVFEVGNGPGADVVAHFFSETDARDYAKWREIQPTDRSQKP
jgi:hypothetical protein